MWINVKLNAAVSIDNLKTQFANNLTEDEFNAIISLDVTTNLDKGIGGKYCPWLFRLYQKKDFNLNQASSIRDAIDYFERNKRRFEKKDIGQYKTMSEFLQTVDTVADTPLSDKELAKQRKKQVHSAGDQDKKLLARDGDFELWTPLTYEGSVSLAQAGGVKARWCTAYNGDDSYYKSYTAEGPLYIFINTKSPSEKYQSCPAAESWFFNIEDRELGKRELYIFLAQHPAISSVFCKLVPELGVSSPSELQIVDGCVIVGDTVVSAEQNRHVVVPEGVTSIGQGAFEDCVELFEVELPDSLTSIGEAAFATCTNLQAISVPEGVTEIGQNAFYRCLSLAEVHLPDSLTEIDISLFSGCESLVSIRLPRQLKGIEEYAFSYCSSLTSISIPESVTSLGDCVFFACKSLTSISLPGSLTSIGDSAFHHCTSLAEVYLPDNLLELSASLFASCDALASVRLPGRLNTIDMYSLYDCKSLTSIAIPDSVTSIGDGAFQHCTSLAEVYLPDNLIELAGNVFDRCTSLKTVYCKTNQFDEYFAKLGATVIHDMPDSGSWEDVDKLGDYL